MSETTVEGRKVRFGLRGLIVAVLAVGVTLGCLARWHRQAGDRAAIVAELQKLGVRPLLEEPTGLGFWIKKRIPGREPWIRDHLGPGWLAVPTVFVCSGLDDGRAPIAMEGLRRLGTVREIHFEGAGLTSEGVDRLRAGLPGVGVVPRSNPSEQPYLRSKTTGEQFALDGLLFEIGLLAALLALGSVVLWPFVSYVRRKRRAAVHAIVAN